MSERYGNQLVACLWFLWHYGGRPVLSWSGLAVVGRDGTLWRFVKVRDVLPGPWGCLLFRGRVRWSRTSRRSSVLFLGG